MIGTDRIAELLTPFGISLTGEQAEKLIAYLDLLLKWNTKINLVGNFTDKDCVTRHFGESLFLSRHAELTGRLLDIGTGAGFPGLALKIACPELAVTLLEPVTKKRAFLKEVVRVCQFDRVSVLGHRLEEYVSQTTEYKYDYATSRAVGGFPSLVEQAWACLKDTGKVCLWVGHDDAAAIAQSTSPFTWKPPIPIPLSHSRELLIGEFQQSR